MKKRIDLRVLVLRSSLALLLAGVALFASPRFVQRVYAADGDVTCTATCRNGSCTGDRSYCLCSCHWFFATPVCNCTGPEKPVDQTPS